LPRSALRRGLPWPPSRILGLWQRFLKEPHSSMSAFIAASTRLLSRPSYVMALLAA
jgi:hypothetical protein